MRLLMRLERIIGGYMMVIWLYKVIWSYKVKAGL